jgi:hypothetical protein
MISSTTSRSGSLRTVDGGGLKRGWGGKPGGYATFSAFARTITGFAQRTVLSTHRREHYCCISNNGVRAVVAAA